MKEQPSVFKFEGTGRCVDTSHGLHPLPTKELSLLQPTHTTQRPTHLVRIPLTATPVAALPEQLAIVTEPSGLAGVCRAAREVAEVWLRARPRLVAVLDGCSSQPAGVRERRVPDWIWGSVRTGTRRTPHARTSPVTPAARRGEYRRRRDVLGGVVARARRRVPRHRQGGLPCKSCWYLKNASRKRG